MSSSLPSGIPEDRDNSGTPVVCSKCNETFDKDSDYMDHYQRAHASSDEDDRRLD